MAKNFFRSSTVHDWQHAHNNKVSHETYLIRSLSERLKNAQSPMKKNRFDKRIAGARVRLLALKLSTP